MKKIMESNAATVATTSAAIEVDPTYPSSLNQLNPPISDMVGQGGEALGSTGGPHVVQSKNSFPPYDLPPNYAYRCSMRMPKTPNPYLLRADNPYLIMHMSLNTWGRHMKYPTTIQPTLSLALNIPLRGKQLVVYPCQTLWRALNFAHNHNPCILWWGESLLLW